MARGGSLNVYRATSFRKGLNRKRSALDLARGRPNEWLTLANNVVYTTSGGVSKRFDVVIYNSSNLGASVGITGGIEFRHSNGTNQIIVGTDDGRIVQLNTDGTTTNRATGLTTGRRWSFAVYNDNLICCNGVDAPRNWDGTTMTSLAGSPPATGSVVVVHQNRVFMLDETQLSRLSFSALNNQEDWTTANNAGSISVYPNDTQNLTGMVSSTNELILQKPSHLYRLQGTAPTAGYTITSVVPAPQITGGLSFQAILTALNDVWTLSRDGVHTVRTVQEFGDLKQSFASEPIAPRFEPFGDFEASLNRLNLAVGVYDRQLGRLYFAVDTNNNAQNDLMLVYDLFTKGWSEWPSFTGGVASMWRVQNPDNGREEVFAGGYDGSVRVLNRSVSTNTVNGEVRHISDLGAATIEKSPRHAYFYFAEQGNWNVTVTTRFDFGFTGGQTYTVSQLAGSRTLGVDWTLGTDPLGRRDVIRRRVDLTGTGEFLEMGVSNTAAGQPFNWLGYEVLWRPRRVVGRGVT